MAAAMTLDQCFKGLADQNRLRIVNLLLRDELCGCDIQYVLDLSQSNVSRHLNYLKRVGLVADRRHGYRVFYRLTSMDDTLRTFLQSAFKRDDMFKSDSKHLKDAIRDGACSQSEQHVRSAERRPTAP